MAAVDMNWLDNYCQLEEPLDKAGAYAIQGLAAQWITRLDGSFSGVMGLPIFETMELLRQVGVAKRPRSPVRSARYRRLPRRPHKRDTRQYERLAVPSCDDRGRCPWRFGVGGPPVR